MIRRTLMVLASSVAVVGAAGCGEDIAAVQQQVDDAQENVDRVQDAITDPAGAAQREIDRATQGVQDQIDEATGVVTDPVGTAKDRARDEADRALDDALGPNGE